MRKYVFYGVTLAFVWPFVTGAMSFSVILQGLILGLPVSFAFRRFYPGDLGLERLEKIPYMLEYLVLFFKELAMSNLEVAYRLLSPAREVNPGLLEYRTSLEHPTAVAVLADSITLTPGTLVLDYSEEDSELLVHCLNSGTEKETRRGIRKMEKILEKTYR